jgi:hypothetical protein
MYYALHSRSHVFAYDVCTFPPAIYAGFSTSVLFMASAQEGEVVILMDNSSYVANSEFSGLPRFCLLPQLATTVSVCTGIYVHRGVSSSYFCC